MADIVQLRPEGLYCAAGGFYIDPWRPVDVAVLTHGHGDHARAGMGRYHTSVEGLPILRWRLGDQDYSVHAYGEPFTLGRARVSLHPAGHVLGSAQVRVEVDGQVWVVSGDYKRQPDPTCTPFEVVPCDTFITEATFGLPIYRWPSAADVARDIVQWRDHCAARGEAAILYCYALGKAQRVLAELMPFIDRPVYLHGAIAAGVDVYRGAGVAMADTRLVIDAEGAPAAAGTGFAGELVLAPPSAAGSAWLRRFRKAQHGFASGWMRLRGNRRRRNMDRGFVVSDHADWPDLLRTVRQTGARRVIATHGDTEALVRTLNESGIAAETLATQYGEDD
ncbi:ligase-associated DNA damage response exonuclease [Achromobacter xylosoxidans]|uniref:ligase-associated DNA damage response exonuclease n=1 Tax=Alcaligenes xylosoxydans xylosoxydans TaxID=85698 RepID=UPI001EEACAF7|nr:ligase-associated DNA damage response exonuclease [Achromobacter xylosoxidans]